MPNRVSLILCGLALVVLTVPLAATAERTTAKEAAVVKVVYNKKLKKKILVTGKGLTLYMFTADTNAPLWKLRDGRELSLRAIAQETLQPFRANIRRVSDLPTLRHIEAVFDGNARSLLDFPKRPDAYDDAGHQWDWNRRRMRHWPRSAYEKVIHRVIARQPIHIRGKRYAAERMQGWYEVMFRESKTGERRIFNLDHLAKLMATKRRKKL